MPAKLHVEWRNTHRGTKYPFSEAASLQSTQGAVLPEGAIIDAAIYPPGAAEGLYLASITVNPRTTRLGIHDRTAQEVASGTFLTSDPPETVALVDIGGRPAGILVSESRRLLLLTALGASVRFAREATEFAATVGFPAPTAGVRGFVLPDGTVVTGDVWFVGGDGVAFLADGEGALPDGAVCGEAVAYGRVAVHVIGDPLFRRRLCAGVNFTAPQFIRGIHFTDAHGHDFTCGPGAGGEVQLSLDGDLGETVLRVGPRGGALRLGQIGPEAA